MSTNPAIWQSLLRWSEFPITYNWKNVVLEFTVTLVTRSLSLSVIPDGRLKKLQLIDTLYRNGWSSVEIANHLNERGILTPFGKAYYPKLVWVTQKKYKNRVLRQLIIGMDFNDIRWTLLVRR
jgi:hypothetical protein